MATKYYAEDCGDGVWFELIRRRVVRERLREAAIAVFWTALLVAVFVVVGWLMGVEAGRV